MNSVSPLIGLPMCKVKYASSYYGVGEYTNKPIYLLIQLEKLLQKNYFLHQSARDGYRSYLQSYASYSLKKIFDINALDLAKVGKAFGFSVPPRVNVSIGGGTGGTGKSGKKRARDDDDDNDEELSEMEVGGGVGEEDRDGDGICNKARRKGKERRVETHGQKKVDKEVYKKSRDRVRQKGSGEQWNR